MAPTFVEICVLATNDGVTLKVILVFCLFQETPALDRACNSLRLLPEANARRKTVFKVRFFILIDLIGSKGFDLNTANTSDRSQGGEGFLLLVSSSLKLLSRAEMYESNPRSKPDVCFKVLEMADL